MRRFSVHIPCLPSILEVPQDPDALLTFGKVQSPLRLPRKTTSEHPKVVRDLQFFTLLTWKCASRQNGMHVFDMSTSKSGPRWYALYILTWERASHHNRVLFSTSQLPKALRHRSALYILASTCASRSNTVHFFNISTSKSVPMLKCFERFDLEMCFAPKRRAIFYFSSGQMAPHPPL